MTLIRSLDPPLSLEETKSILSNENLSIEDLECFLTHTKDPDRQALIAAAIFQTKGRLSRKVRELEQALEQARHWLRLADEALQRITRSEEDEPDPFRPSKP